MKYQLLFFLSFFGLLLASCSEDDSPTITTGSTVPMLQIISSDTTISADDTLAAGSKFSIAFSAKKGPVDMISWTLSLNNGNLPNYTDVPVSNPSSFTEVINEIDVPLFKGNYVYTLSLKDANNITVLKSISIAVIDDANINETSISIIATDSTIYQDTTLALGTTFNILVLANKGFYKMDTWSVLVDGVPLSGFNMNSVPNDSVFSTNIEGIQVPNIEGTYTYTFQITNVEGVVISATWEITAADIPTFTEYKNIELGAENNSMVGGFFLARTVTVSNLSQANASNGEAVEFFYHSSSISGPSIFSPNDPNAVNFFGGAIINWFIRFNTKIEKSTINYSNVTAQTIDEIIVSGTKADSLAVGDVILIETALGLKAILIIRNLTPGNTGSIVFDIKIVD